MTMITVAEADTLLSRTWLQSRRPGNERAGYRLVCPQKATHKLNGSTCPSCHTSMEMSATIQRELLPSGVGLALTRLPTDLYREAVTALTRGAPIQVEHVAVDDRTVSTLIMGDRAGQVNKGRSQWGTWADGRLRVEGSGLLLGLDGEADEPLK